MIKVFHEKKELCLTDIETVKRLLTKAGFSFQKSLGQNFITDPFVCPEMVRRSGITGEDEVLEIGAGVGVLTTELARKAHKTLSVEVDGRLLPVLAETLHDYRNAEVVLGDIMKTDIEALIREHFENPKIHVCANLPYYITSPIIMKLLEHREHFSTLTLMVQKEAADRLTAEVGSRDSGAITVAVNYYAEVENLFLVSRNSFTPSPKVDSSVIRLKIRETPPVTVKNEAFFFEVIKAAFSQRRKTAANGLSSLLCLSKESVHEALRKAGLDERVRAETLSMEELAAVSDILYEMRQTNG